MESTQNTVATRSPKHRGYRTLDGNHEDALAQLRHKLGGKHIPGTGKHKAIAEVQR